MKFEADDLDWAMGELAHLFMQANRTGIYPHELNPALFHSAWSVLCAQPFEVAWKCRETLMKMSSGNWRHLTSIEKSPKRYANPHPY
jgi:hypothetical protein